MARRLKTIADWINENVEGLTATVKREHYNTDRKVGRYRIPKKGRWGNAITVTNSKGREVLHHNSANGLRTNAHVEWWLERWLEEHKEETPKEPEPEKEPDFYAWLEEAWQILDGVDWSRQSEEWRQNALRWRHKTMKNPPLISLVPPEE
jgi:hypothetical protein